MLFDMLVTVMVMLVTTLFETEVKNLIFIVKQFLDNECSITLKTLKIIKYGFAENIVIYAP